MQQLITTLGHPVRLVFVILISLIGTSAPAAASQGDPTNLQVGASPPWTTTSIAGAMPEDAQGQVLTDGRNFVLVRIDEIADPAQQRLDALAALGAASGSIATLDSGESAAVAYWLDVMQVENAPWGAFTLARTLETAGFVELTIYAGPVDGFAAGVESAQASIQVNGEPVLDGVGGEGLQELLLANVNASGEPSVPDGEPTEQPDAEPAGEPTEEPEDESSDEDGQGKIGDDGNAEVPYEEAGMVGPRQYVSPQFGVEIEWTADWDLDDSFGDPVLSDRKTGEDRLHLLWHEEWSAWLIVFIFEPGPGVTVSDIVDFAGSRDAVEETFGADGTVALADASPSLGGVVILVDEGASDPTLIYDEFRYSSDGEAIVVVRMISLESEVTAGAIEAASADITIDGDPILVYYPPADVAAAHAG